MRNLIILTASLTLLVSIDCVKVSPKLDFGEVEDLNSGSGNRHFVSNFPKIQVTVDTTKLKRGSSPESKSEESSSGSSGSGSESVEKQTVGVRTDITIEISEEKNETKVVDDKIDKKEKDVGNKKKEDDDNASVPVFKGKNTPPKVKPIPNDVFGRRNDGPVFFHKTDDEHHQRNGGHNIDHWNKYLPITGIWTTERPHVRRYDYDNQDVHEPTYYKGYTPTTAGHHGWKPCYCSVYQPWKSPNPVWPMIPSRRKGVDDKLDGPFKQHNK